MKQLRARRAGAICLLALMISTAAAAGEPVVTGSPKFVVTPEMVGRALQSTPQPRVVRRPRQRTSSSNRRAVWTTLGALGGAVAGIYLGSTIERAQCGYECGDDPGMKGALIGIPVGAVAGGVAGFLLAR